MAHLRIVNRIAIRRDPDGMYRCSIRQNGERVTLEEFATLEAAIAWCETANA